MVAGDVLGVVVGGGVLEALGTVDGTAPLEHGRVDKEHARGGGGLALIVVHALHTDSRCALGHTTDSRFGPR